MLTVVPGDGSGHEGGKDSSLSLIDEIVREGARRMLAEALRAGVDAYIAAHAAERDDDGRGLVVRNGCHQPREILTSAGAIEVTVPRVNDKRTGPDTGERKRFSSAIVPPWCRKTPKITEVLPLLYLHGLSSGDFVPALGQFLGSSAGLSAAVITKLTETWKAEQRAFAARDLSAVDYVYLWADGIHVNIRLEEHKLCLLVMIGVRADGRKELIALADGYRESAESWADLLRDCARRGMRAPVLAIGDGALGFWNGLREVFPEAREGRCWFHKTANVLAALPKSAHPGAKKALAEIWGAEDKEHALAAVKAFETAYGVKFPKAAAKITDDADQLLAFYDYPAEHWVHLRTTNPIESTFATVRHRTKITKGPGGRAGHGVQAHRISAGTLAGGERSSARRAGPRRGPFRARHPSGTARTRRGMTAVTVVSAFPAGRGGDAAALVFEYMAATQAETGQPVPAGISELPAVLQRECRDLPAVYRLPGALLIAGHSGQPAGCVGLAPCPAERTAEIRRLYVRPAHRGKGIASTLMSHAHHHAAQHGMTRLILDVLPARTTVISFYRHLGYTETEPYATKSPVPMIYMERPITSDDILSIHRS